MRADKLTSRTTEVAEQWVVEKFAPGRHNSHLQEHGFSRTQLGLHATRYMTFYSKARIDGLCRREQTPNSMKVSILVRFVGRYRSHENPTHSKLAFSPLFTLVLVQVFHSTPATPSVLLEALLLIPCVWVTNSGLKPLIKSHGQAFATWTTYIVKPTVSHLAPVFAASILFLSLIPPRSITCYALVQ
ncbi:unnamed protein product [Protopolystoma xenopodis]|uniref:Dynein regulatory complex subunit 7 MORN domain-containing protein n=1 Tax=Protopolystoma xenopodis TaxID=117903 RepID=A0A3S5AG20_9PLAT|nr:unnamed protein product [Protopolystoma xenopodis]